MKKICTKCDSEKPLDDFYRRELSSDGRGVWCKECMNEQTREWRRENRDAYRERHREYHAEWRRRNPDIVREHQRRADLKKSYGMTEDDFHEMLRDQGGGCAICGRTPGTERRNLSVDHCHERGHVRGILCGPCNTGLGMFGDDIAMLRAAREYLVSHRGGAK